MNFLQTVFVLALERICSNSNTDFLHTTITPDVRGKVLSMTRPGNGATAMRGYLYDQNSVSIYSRCDRRNRFRKYSIRQ
jgi:hypothetical protein